MKVMRNRGEDNHLVGFGHFAEARLLKGSPEDVVVDPDGKLHATYTGAAYALGHTY